MPSIVYLRTQARAITYLRYDLAQIDSYCHWISFLPALIQPPPCDDTNSPRIALSITLQMFSTLSHLMLLTILSKYLTHGSAPSTRRLTHRTPRESVSDGRTG